VQHVLITGGGGRIGRTLRAGLASADRPLRLLDLADQEPARPDEPVEVVRADLDDPAAVARACAGVDAVVHLGGIPTEAPWADLLRVNVDGTRILLEAARDAGVRRVVLASSVHAAGYYRRPAGPVGDGVAAGVPRPDGYYGWSKAALEALGSLFADRFGMTVFALRIGAFTPQPTDERQIDMWLAPEDCVRLVTACLDADVTGFRVLWGVSANADRWLSLAEGREIGYEPREDSARFAGSVRPDETGTADLLGGTFTIRPLGGATG
jgi:uronate dehydrogenase